MSGMVNKRKKPQITPENLALAQQRIAGKSLEQISTDTGLPKSTVYARLNTDQLRQYIEDSRQRLISKSLPRAIANIEHGIESYTYTDDTQLREHGYKSSVGLLDSVGISIGQSKTPQIIVNTAIITPAIESILNAFGKALSDNVIDVTDSLPEVNTAKES